MILYYTASSLHQAAADLISGISGFTLQEHSSVPEKPAKFGLYLQPDGLVVYTPSLPTFKLYDFYSQFLNRRVTNVHREILLQAINLKSSSAQPLMALDATAGLGRDSILFALAGFEVTMVERNPYLAVILNYLLTTFAKELPRLKMVYARSHEFLASVATQYDVVYLDPMFMDNKHAKSKKDLQIIDYLVDLTEDAAGGATDDMAQLFTLAKEHCRNRIVVKRDNKQATLIPTPKPTYSKSGKTVRFDVYQIG